MAALAFFGALTIFVTWPLAAHLSDSLIGPAGDNYYFMWLTGWYPEAILRLGVSPWSVPWLSYPEGFQLAYTEMTPGTPLFAWPLTLLFGPTLAYNFVMLASVTLAGVAAYLWAFRATRSHPAALLAGVVFTFRPDHLIRLGGHITLVCTQWLAFYLILLDSTIRARTPGRGAPVAAGVFLGLLALSSQYLFYHALVLSPLYLLGHVALRDRSAWKRAALWRRLAVAGLVAAPFISAAEAPYVLLALSGNGPGSRPISEVQLHGASLTDFIVPAPQQLVARYLGNGFFDSFAGASLHEHDIYLGLVALALVCLAAAWKRFGPVETSEIGLWLFMGAATGVLALGVSLNVARQTVLVDLPAWTQAWYPYAQTFIPLPGYLLFKWLPFYGAMRVWTRWAFSTSLFVSLLAGAGTAAALARMRSWARRPLAAVLCLLVLAEFSMGYTVVMPVESRAVDRWLAQQPGHGAVVNLPIYESIILPQMVYYAQVSGKPYVGSNFGSFWSPQAKRLIGTVNTFPDDRSIALLRELGVQWVVIDAAAFSTLATVRPQIESAGLRFRTVADGMWGYELAAQ